MKRCKEFFDVSLIKVAGFTGFVVGLVPKVMWLFIFLELLLFCLTKHTRLEVFVIQFPMTLWVLTKKDGK